VSGPMLPAGAFSGRTILVTGGGTGLGRSMGNAFLELGAKLVICGRRADVLEQAAAEMTAATGSEVLPVRCDVRDPAEVEALLAAATGRFGRVHGVVNNAAGNFICPTERLSANAFHTVVDIVLKGTVNCTLAFGKRWIAEKTPGVFLNIGATYAPTGTGYVVPSSVAKAGVLNLTRSLASEWGKYEIRLNAILPGPFPTEGAWSRILPPEVIDAYDVEERIPAGRVGEHRELCNLAAYLLSDYAAYVTGACVTIDGGESARSAGTFNYLEGIPPETWDALQARTKPRK
jgi:NAD(P)-dependent dehydrogenase (short-subunit alcohol dehydrogenase family)